MKSYRSVFAVVLMVFGFSMTGIGQSTAFTYQGSISDNSVPPNGTYQMRFRLFDALSGGAQIGATVENTAVSVVNGFFTAELEFGGSAFVQGTDRFLQIEVRRNSGEAYVLLAPRQRLARVPFSTHAVTAASAGTASNSTNLGGIAANQYVLTGDARLADARNPLPGSTNYIQNTATQQASSNFNISGNGTAAGTLSGNIVNATTQFNLGGSRFVGGGSNGNSFVGQSSGAVNSGSNNSFFGFQAGLANTTGLGNSFFGTVAGAENTIGSENSFFGLNTGRGNTSGNRNSYFGRLAGRFGTTGDDNTFVGFGAGDSNLTGSGNTAVGSNANVVEGASNATAIGTRALATVSNTLILGAINGTNGATANTRVGIGTTTPTAKLTVSGAGIFSSSNSARFDLVNTTFGSGFSQQVNDAGEWVLATTGGTRRLTVSLVGVLFTESDIVSSGDIIADGAISVGRLSAAGSQSVCRETSLNLLASCSSSLRYKTNVNSFGGGLDLIRRLRPVTFNWKADNMEDLGLIAEEVAEVEPLLTTTNKEGEIEGVKYDRIGVVLVNAVNEQQSEIERLKADSENKSRRIEELLEAHRRQQAQIDALTKLFCSANPAAAICRQRP